MRRKIHGSVATSTSTPLKRRRGPLNPKAPRCSTWYHWNCVARNTLDPVDIIDKVRHRFPSAARVLTRGAQWYCSDCLKANPDFKVSYREPPRKSSRTTAKINYANLNVHMGHDPDRFITLAESKAAKIIDAFGAPPPEPSPTPGSDSESDGGPPRKKRATEKAKGPPGFEGFRVFKGHQLDEKWLYEDPTAMTEPIVVDNEDGKALEGLDMGMPPPTIMISDVARQVGQDVPVEVIDVASQSELSRWTLGQWATYYEDPKRDKVRNVISLEVSETKLGKQIRLPRVVRLLDWVDNVWPDELKVEGSGAYPKVQKYCLMSVARCWTVGHVDLLSLARRH